LTQSSATGITGYPFSFSLWIKTTAAVSQTYIALNRATVSNVYYRVRVLSNGTVRLEAANTTQRSATSSATVNDGNWHHIVAVFASASSRLLYVDGAPDGSSAPSVNFHASATALTIGRNGGSTPGIYANGQIDEISIFNSALGAPEVVALYGAGSPMDPTANSGNYVSSTALMNWWRMGDLAGDDPLTGFADGKGSSALQPAGLDLNSVDSISAP